jgi:hypothetical protein
MIILIKIIITEIVSYITIVIIDINVSSGGSIIIILIF